MREREANLISHDNELDLSHLTSEEADKVRQILRLRETLNDKLDERDQIDEEINELEDEINMGYDDLGDEAWETLNTLP